MFALDDTIAAAATPPGEGGVGIVRVSGPLAFPIADRLFVRAAGPPSSVRSHTIHYGHLVEPESGDLIDDALLLAFRRPRSYTGEDVVEFSCHGGPVTLGRVLHAVLQAGARAAAPGEFTQRAFLNGRMDLAQAEAVCDLIRAKTDAAQRMALRQRKGTLSREVKDLRQDVLGTLAAVEVTIDFSDEVGDLNYPAIVQRIAGILDRIDHLIAESSQGRLLREGVRVAIVGRPNVGKSSLMNAILRDNRAIVTPVAGTTRDVIEESANIHGIPVTVIDTAGLRHTVDLVERIGVERAHAALESAAVALLVLDLSAGFTEEDAAIATGLDGIRSVWALNKADLVSDAVQAQVMRTVRDFASAPQAVLVSALTGHGLDRLEEAIVVAAGGSHDSDTAVVSNVRHLREIELAGQSLHQAIATAEARLPPDFITIDLRGALDALGRITGETTTDDVIHRIFADFCIGK